MCVFIRKILKDILFSFFQIDFIVVVISDGGWLRSPTMVFTDHAVQD